MFSLTWNTMFICLLKRYCFAFLEMGNIVFFDPKRWWKDDIYLVSLSFPLYFRNLEIWFQVKCNDQLNEQSNSNKQTKLKKSILLSHLRDYFHAYIVVRGTITVAGANKRDRKIRDLFLKNRASFILLRCLRTYYLNTAKIIQRHQVVSAINDQMM